MPLNRTTPTTTASNAARSDGKAWANSAANNVNPAQVQSGTSQFNAAAPSHLTKSPGTMWKPR